MKEFNFSENELGLLGKHTKILNDIEQLESSGDICFSVLDSKLSKYLWGTSDAVSTQKVRQTLHLAKNPDLDIESLHGGLLNGFHIVLPNISNKNEIENLIKLLKPWRKGPFCLHLESDNTKYYIDSEWRSDIKMRLILDSLQKINFDLKGKEILDVGCNNGYYMFDLAMRDIKRIVGVDPIAIFFLQFYFIYKFSGLRNISFRLLGIENISLLNNKFDLILCLGVLYHRKEPFAALKSLKQVLKKDGIIIIETLILNIEEEMILCPYPTYAKMSNVFYIFSPNALKNLALKVGFKECRFLSFSYTNNEEQRTTDFINKKSLGDFLESNKTFEGYPPACRGFFVLY